MNVFICSSTKRRMLNKLNISDSIQKKINLKNDIVSTFKKKLGIQSVTRGYQKC